MIAQLPSDTEVPGLLEDIDEKGSTSGLLINSIKLTPEVHRSSISSCPSPSMLLAPITILGDFRQRYCRNAKDSDLA